MSHASSRAGVDIDELLAPGREVEAYLQQEFGRRDLPENLREAAIYAALGPGKRMRPVLVIRCCEAMGGTHEQAMPAAAAIEMIHCFSLVHDDLPAMDDDDLRRGRPTLHRHTNEAMAILTGDLLNTFAFELIAERYGESAPDRVGPLVRELSSATCDMIAGQVYDTLPTFPDAMPPLERLRCIHRHKTGALIRAACRLGGICGGGLEAARFSRLEALTQYGEVIGLMFQIVDDLLDVTSTADAMGKAVGKDEDRGKLTYPGLLGIEPSRRQVAELREQAHAALEPFDVEADPLRQLAEFLAVREK